MTASGGATWVVGEARGLVRDTRRLLAGRNLAAAAGALTYYAGIAVVPWLLLATWTTTWWRGVDGAEQRLLDLRVLVPPDMGARAPYDALVEAGTHLGVVGALVVLFPASFYGEGLRRAALDVHPTDDAFTGWRARIAVLASLAALPLLAWVYFAVGDVLAPLSPEGGGGGVGALLVRIVAAFTVTWLVLSAPLTWCFRAVMPRHTRWWVALAGGLATGSFLAGFLQGFHLFLSIPIDVGIPFGGLGVVGAVVAVGLWLYVLNTVVLVGWVATRALEARVRREPAPAGDPEAVT